MIGSPSPAWGAKSAAPDSVFALEKSGIQLPEQMADTKKVPLKLLDAIKIGLTRNVDLKKALLDRATQVGDLALAERIFEPELFLNAFYRMGPGYEAGTAGGGPDVIMRLMTNGTLRFNWTVTDARDIPDSNRSYTSGISFSFSQPLLRNAGITVGTAPLVSARYVDESNVQLLRSQIMNRVTSIQETYWALLLALQNRLSSVRSLEAGKDILRRNKILIKAGRMARADLVQTQQEVARARVDILEQDFAVQDANRALVTLLDLPPEVVILPVEGFNFSKVKVDFKKMMATALKKSPEITQSRVAVQQSELNLKLARSQAKNALDLELSTVMQTNEGRGFIESLDPSRNWAVSLNLSIPFGLPKTKLKQEVIRAGRALEKTRLDLHTANLRLRQGVRTGVNDVRRSLLQIEMAQTSLKLAMRKYEIERNRLELGRSSNFQVLSFQRDLVSARDAEHQAIVNYLNSLARLEETVGITLETWKIEVDTPEEDVIPALRMTATASSSRDTLRSPSEKSEADLNSLP